MYKCCFPTSRKIITSKDVTFNELNMSYLKNEVPTVVENMDEGLDPSKGETQ